MPDLKQLFFRPTQSFQDIAPALFVVFMILLVVLVLWTVALVAKKLQLKKIAWKRFSILANRFGLNRQELSVLRNLAVSSCMAVPSRLMTSRDHFERAARVLERHGKRYEKKIVRSLRAKLYGDSFQRKESCQSTETLPAGTRLLIQYLNDPDSLFWGHLVDNDRQGLIVIVPSNREIRTPLRLNTHLEITAYIPDADPIVFVTWVKAVIPGPRKMVILGHSDFIVNQKEIYEEVKLVGPQFQSGKPLRPMQKNFHPHNSSSRAAQV